MDCGGHVGNYLLKGYKQVVRTDRAEEVLAFGTPDDLMMSSDSCMVTLMEVNNSASHDQVEPIIPASGSRPEP